MLRASLLANAEILPQARQGSYFFNRIGRELPVASVINERLFVGQAWGLEFNDRTPSSQTSLFLYYFRESSQCQRTIALSSLHAEGTPLEE